MVEEAGSAAEGRVDARNAVGVQVGEGNTQIVYQYAPLTWGDGVAAPPLTTVSGHVESPYRGLASYDERDAAFFFGREDTTDEVLDRLSASLDAETGIVFVSGVSGAGKSSVLRAGVLPRLRGGGLAGAPEASGWPCLLFTPGPRPLDELALQLGELAGVDAAAVRATLTVEPAAIALTARQAVRRHARGGAEGRMVLVVDQFEQLYTQCDDPDHRAAFLVSLQALVTGASAPALALVGVRADFEARCAEEELLAPAVQDRYLVTSLTPRRLRAAITEPARMAGAAVEPALVDTLLAELGAGVGAGALPLLSHALDQTWRRRTGRDLTLTDYERTGGVEGAVAVTAQATYDALTPDQQAVAKQVFLRLTVTDVNGRDLSMRTSRSELLAGRDATAVDAVVEAFTEERLLTVGADTVEVSHEVLLSAWPLLRDDWLAESRSRRLVLSRLHLTAGEWDRHRRDPAYLYTGSLLDASLGASRQESLTSVDAQFLDASLSRRRAATNRRRALVAGLAVLCVALAGVALVAVRARRDATRQRDVAIGRTLVQQSETTGDSDAGLSKLESVAGWRMAPSTTSYAAMLDAVMRPGSATLTGHSGTVRGMAVDPRGRLMASGGSDGTLRLWDVAHRRQVAVLEHGPDAINAVAMSPDGRIVAAGGADGIVRLYDVRSRKRIGSLTPSGDKVMSAAFAPSGDRLATVTLDGVLTWWDVASLRRTRTVHLPQDLWSIAYAPDGSDVAVGGEESGAVRLVSPTGRSRVVVKTSGTPLAPSSVPVHGVTFSPDGTLLSVAAAGRVEVFDAGRIRRLGDLRVNAVTSAFTPDGQYVLTGNQSGSVWAWRLNGIAEVCDLAGGTGPVLAVAVLHDGVSAVSAGADGAVRLWDLSSCLPRHSLVLGQDAGSEVNASVSWPRSSRQMVSLGNHGLIAWNAATGSMEGTPRFAGLDHARVLADGRHVVATAPTRTGFRLETVDLSIGATRVLYRGRGTVDDVEVSPDGRLAAVAAYGSSRSTELVPLDGTKPRALDTNHVSETSSVAFSPDGRTLAAAGADSSLELWNVRSAKRTARSAVSRASVRAGATDSALRALAFAPDGRAVATADNRVRLWSVAGGNLKQVRVFDPGGSTLLGIAFAPNGHVLATGGMDGTVRLWNTSTGHAVGSAMPGHAGIVRNISFSPDGHWLASAGQDGRLLLWDTSALRDPASSLCRAAGTDLTRAQWRAAVGDEAAYRTVCG